MVNYQLGKIYKMLNLVTQEFYIGSTCKRYLSDRKSGHNMDSRDQSRQSLLMKSIRGHGINNFEITLVEAFPCDDKDALRARERYHIELLKPVLNQMRPIITVEENKARNLAYDREYRKANPERIKAIQKRGYQKNKEKIAQNAARKADCPCGAAVRHADLKRHIKSDKHQRWSTDCVIPEYLFPDT